MKDLNRRDFIKITAAGVGAAGLATSVPGFAAEIAQKLKLPQSITEAGRRFRDGSLTSEALTKAYLAAIKQLEPKLSMFITLTDELALKTARAMDFELKAGKNRGPLHGIPIVYKDLYDTVKGGVKGSQCSGIKVVRWIDLKVLESEGSMASGA